MPRSVWLSDADPNALFKSGDVVSYLSGSWQIADFAVNIADFEWASVYMPQDEVRATNFGNAASMVVFEGPQQESRTRLHQVAVRARELHRALGDLGVHPGGRTASTSRTPRTTTAFEIYNQEIAASPPIVGEIKPMELQYGAQGVTTEGDPVRDETVKYLAGEQDVDTTIENINAQFTDQLGALELTVTVHYDRRRA